MSDDMQKRAEALTEQIAQMATAHTRKMHEIAERQARAQAAEAEHLSHGARVQAEEAEVRLEIARVLLTRERRINDQLEASWAKERVTN